MGIIKEVSTNQKVFKVRLPTWFISSGYLLITATDLENAMQIFQSRLDHLYPDGIGYPSGHQWEECPNKLIRYIYTPSGDGYRQRNLNWCRSASGVYLSHENLFHLKYWERVSIHKSGVYDYQKEYFPYEGFQAKVVSLYPKLLLRYLSGFEVPDSRRTFSPIYSKIDNFSFVNPLWLNSDSSIHYISLQRCLSSVTIEN